MKKKKDLLYFLNDIRALPQEKRTQCEAKHILIMQDRFVENLYNTLKKTDFNYNISDLIIELIFPSDPLLPREDLPFLPPVKKLTKKNKIAIEEAKAIFKKDHYEFLTILIQFWHNPETYKEYAFEAFLSNIKIVLNHKIQEEKTSEMSSFLYLAIYSVLKELKYGCDAIALITKLFPEIVKSARLNLNALSITLNNEELERIEQAKKLLTKKHAQTLDMVENFWKLEENIKRYSFKDFIISIAEKVEIALSAPQQQTYHYPGEEPFTVEEIPLLRPHFKSH